MHIEEVTGFFRKLVEFYHKFGVRYCIISDGVKIYFLKLEINFLKELHGVDLRDKNTQGYLCEKFKWLNCDYLNSYLQYLEDIKEKQQGMRTIDLKDSLAFVPISYTVFTNDDDIPFLTAFLAILLELSTLSDDEIRLSKEELELLDEMIERPLKRRSNNMKESTSVDHTGKKIQSESIKFHKKSSYYHINHCLTCDDSASLNLNKDGFIGRILQSKDQIIAQVYLVSKKEFIECFKEYKDLEGVLPDRLVFKMYDDKRVKRQNADLNNHYGISNRHVTEAYILEGLSHGIYDNDMKVPELFAHGYFHFKPKNKFYGYSPIDISGKFLLMSYIEMNPKITMHHITMININEELKSSYYDKAISQLNKLGQYGDFGIVHNSIARRNLIIGRDDQVYLIDFNGSLAFRRYKNTRDYDKLKKLFSRE